MTITPGYLKVTIYLKFQLKKYFFQKFYLALVFYDLNSAKSLIIFITVLVSMPSLFILSLFGVLITLGLSKQNYLSSIITLPFFMPNIIFSAKSVQQIDSSFFLPPELFFLMAINKTN